MSTLHASLAALALAFAGMVALAFAMDRHYEQLTGARALPAGRGRQLRCLGVPLLALSSLPAFWAWGATAGTVAWLGFLSCGALAAVGLIGVHARWTARLACLATLVVAADLVWFFSRFGTSGLFR